MAPLGLIETQVPSAIVLDLTPPRPDGREVQRVLKSNPHTRGVPIVAVAGADQEDVDLENVTCLLKKPLSVDALVAAVKHVVRQSLPRRVEAS